MFATSSARPVRFSHLLVLLALFSTPFKPPSQTSGYLHTAGNQIVDASGNIIGLSGVNWFGFETENRAPHGLWSRNLGEMLDQIQRLGYNVIRLPFSNAMLAPGTKPTGINYAANPDLANLTSLEVMDRMIAGARARGLRVILDNHRSTPGGGPESNGLWYAGSFSEEQWIADWKMLAQRYKGDVTVIGMDLRNEPHGACWGCGDPSRDWRLAAEKAGNAILSVNPELLIIVEGIANHNGQNTWWGGNLIGARDFPVRLQVPNRLVYSPHEYPASMYPQSWFSDANYPNNLPAVWDNYWGYLAVDTPVLIGEFGTRLETEKDRQWLQKLTGYIQSKHLHWTFWSLNPNSGDTGGLLLDDWLTVHQQKQDILKTIQYPSLGSGSSFATPTFGPVPSVVPAPTSTATVAHKVLVLDDFESGSLQNWGTFYSANSYAGMGLLTPGYFGNYAMRVAYNIGEGGWGGVERHFNGSQNWRDYRSIGFAFYGTNSGATIRFEILDNRAPGRQGDSAERFEYKFSDSFSGWRTFQLPWNAFTRRSDWQPEGAPNDGFTLTEVWGFNFSPVSGAGVFQLDDVRLSDP